MDCKFVQNNQSLSNGGMFRGLHFQIKHLHSKLMCVLAGEIFEVADDLREGSATNGKCEEVSHSASNKRQPYIPRGFARDFWI